LRIVSTNALKIRVNRKPEDNTTQRGATFQNQKSGQEVAKIFEPADGEQKHAWPKGDVRHWGKRLFRATYTRGGLKSATTDWCVRIAYRGRREVFNTGTPNAEAAAKRALNIYRRIVGAGWDEALVEFKPKAAPKKALPATVGSLIEAATRLSSARSESLDTYAKALRRITAAVIGLEDGRKYDFKRGSAEWRAKVDATSLERLTPAAVLAWKNAFLKSADGPEERNAAVVTVNSLLRNSKALVSKRIRPFLEGEITLPTPLWFEGVPAEKEPSLRYRSRIDAGTILAAAQAELAEQEAEAFKALLLTLVCGLRRSEADALTWDQVDLEAGILEIRDTEHKALKSRDSAGQIGLDGEVVAILKRFHQRKRGAFVLESPTRAKAPHGEHKSRTYRCDATFNALLDWLKAQGVGGRRPIHTLRKEIGSIIASRDGIFAASRYLRHSDIRITSRLYADSKKPVMAGLGALLLPPQPEKDVESRKNVAADLTL
jgi:integrase